MAYEEEKYLDRAYLRGVGLVGRHAFVHRLLARLFRRTIKRVASVALSRSYERGVIDSAIFHEIDGIFDRMLWPERVPPPKPVPPPLRKFEPKKTVEYESWRRLKWLRPFFID